MPTPDFLKMKCVSTELPQCSFCAKEIIIPLSSVELFCKDGDKAIILVVPTMLFPDPSCPVMGSTKRFICTDMNWADVLSKLDGRVADIGNIKLHEYPNTSFFR